MVSSTKTVIKKEVSPVDVEMKNVDESPKEETPTDPDLALLEEIKEQVKTIERYVNSKEPRFMNRVLRCLLPIRKKLNHRVLTRLINGYYTFSTLKRDELLAFIEEPMDLDVNSSVANFKARSNKSSQTPLLIEVDIYLHLLLLLCLIDTGNYEKATECSDLLVTKFTVQNQRTLDLLAAKCTFYHVRCYELTNKLRNVKGLLHNRLRIATLRNDYEGQAVYLNCLIRLYLHYNLYDQANKLVSKSVFPQSASINEWARFLYYLGRLKATQLDYSDAHKNLLQALRKAPQNSAIGFRQTVQKLAIAVELLLGDIPDRSLFRDPILRHSLVPYFQLTQAVRTGNLARFNEVLENFGNKFQADHTYTLIIRLRHNVIKTGVRMISLSYSKISFVDIAQKLCLDNAEDAEYIVAKAIRDGVIEATINHEKGFMQSKEIVDVYCTAEPQAAFHQRINFCFDIHNQSVKAMRYPPKSYNTDLETAEERREREQQDLELAKELYEKEDDADF